MGFRPEPKHYRLHFTEDEELSGLEVTMQSLSVNEYNQMLSNGMISGLSQETITANEWMIDLFVTRLVSWNLENEEGAVPTTKDGVLSIERWILARVITGWQMAMVTVPLPLNQQSSDGKRSEEQSLGLESASESQQN